MGAASLRTPVNAKSCSAPIHSQTRRQYYRPADHQPCNHRLSLLSGRQTVWKDNCGLEVWELKPLVFVGSNLLAFAVASSAPQAAAQLPPGARVRKEISSEFPGVPAVRKVIFYDLPSDSIGFVLVGPKAEILAQTSEPIRLGFFEGTGVLDLTGDARPEVVMVGVAGAKTLQATIYTLERGKLREIGRWSGWGFRVVTLRGQRMVAYTPGQYGTLPQLYAWRDGSFRDVSDQFPEYFNREIDAYRRLLEGREALPASVLVEACELGARASIYGKRYQEAKELCRRALWIVKSSSRVLFNLGGKSKEEFALERQSAVQQIETVQEKIRRAEKESLSRLP